MVNEGDIKMAGQQAHQSTTRLRHLANHLDMVDWKKGL